MFAHRYAVVCALVVGSAAFLALTGCDMFEVDNPQQIEAEQLDDPLFMEPLVIGAEARLATSLGAHQVTSALVSDELVNLGPDPGHSDLDHGQLNPENSDWSYSNGVAAIFSADDAVRRVRTLLSGQTLRPGDRQRLEALLPRALVAAGYSRLYMAMYFPYVTIAGGPAEPAEAVLAAAVGAFTEAVEAARGFGDHPSEVRALAGRARVYAYLGAIDAAAEDARAALTLEPRFTYRLAYNNYDFRTLVDYVRWWRWMGADPGYPVSPVSLDENGGVPTPGDPRVVLSRDGVPVKTYTRDQGMMLAKWQEMRLILAEFAWRGGRLEEAVEEVNAVRTQGQTYALVGGAPQLIDVAIAPFAPDVLNAAQVRDQIIYERAAEFWLEGLRWPDARRFLGPPFDHPAALSWPPGSWSSVSDLKQQLPIGITERRQNPNL